MVPPPWGCNHLKPVPRAHVDPKNNGKGGGVDPEDATMPQSNQQEAVQENPDLDNFQRPILMTETVNKL